MVGTRGRGEAEGKGGKEREEEGILPLGVRVGTRVDGEDVTTLDGKGDHGRRKTVVDLTLVPSVEDTFKTVDGSERVD